MRRHMVLVAVISMVRGDVFRGEEGLVTGMEKDEKPTTRVLLPVSGRQCDAGHVMTALHRDKWRHTLSPMETRQHINNVASRGEGEGHTINIDMIKLIYFFNTYKLMNTL